MSHDADEGGDDGFRLMFVTLSLILLAFFILLNSMAVRDDSKTRKALGSLLGAFGLLPGSNSVDSSGSFDFKQQSLLKNEGLSKAFENAKSEFEHLETTSDLSTDDGDFSFDPSTGEVKVILSEAMLFPAGTAVLSLKVFGLLEKVAAIAVESGGRVIVSGHTDNRKTRGTSNWELSMRRGTLVARHLESVGPLSRGRIEAGGSSHFVPREPNTTKEGRNANRRVEILIRTKKD